MGRIERLGFKMQDIKILNDQVKCLRKCELMDLWYQKGHFLHCNRKREESMDLHGVMYNKPGIINLGTSHQMAPFSVLEVYSKLCAGSDLGKEEFGDYQCRTRDSQMTRVFRDHEFIVIPISSGLSPELQCSVALEDAMKRMKG